MKPFLDESAFYRMKHIIQQDMTGPQTIQFFGYQDIDASDQTQKPTLTSMEPLSETDEDETSMEDRADDDACETGRSQINDSTGKVNGSVNLTTRSM